MKRVLSIILVIVWCGLIFSFSNSNGEESEGLSDKFIIKVTTTLTNVKEGSEEMEKIVDKYSFLVRKCAHFFIYFVLGFLTIGALYNNYIYKNTIIYAVIFCILYAISDEVHQMFIDGRGESIKDVLLDSSASMFSIYFYSRFIVIRSRHEKNK